jgi:putative oxidoreductase
MTWKAFLFPKFEYNRYSLAILLLRIVFGSAMMIHGWGKIQTPFTWMGPDSGTPALFQFLAALSEFGGGLAWVLGLLTPLASFGIASTMMVAVYTHAVVRGDPFVGKGGPSYELASIFLVVALLLMIAGPGKLSLDHLLTRNRLRN